MVASLSSSSLSWTGEYVTISWLICNRCSRRLLADIITFFRVHFCAQCSDRVIHPGNVCVGFAVNYTLLKEHVVMMFDRFMARLRAFIRIGGRVVELRLVKRCVVVVMVLDVAASSKTMCCGCCWADMDLKFHLSFK